MSLPAKECFVKSQEGHKPGAMPSAVPGSTPRCQQPAAHGARNGAAIRAVQVQMISMASLPKLSARGGRTSGIMHLRSSCRLSDQQQQASDPIHYSVFARQTQLRVGSLRRATQKRVEEAAMATSEVRSGGRAQPDRATMYTKLAAAYAVAMGTLAVALLLYWRSYPEGSPFIANRFVFSAFLWSPLIVLGVGLTFAVLCARKRSQARSRLQRRLLLGSIALVILSCLAYGLSWAMALLVWAT